METNSLAWCLPGMASAGFRKKPEDSLWGIVAASLLVPVVFLVVFNIVFYNPSTSPLNACINNLRQLDGAKQQWALEHKKESTEAPTESDLASYLRDSGWPMCPAGGHYTMDMARAAFAARKYFNFSTVIPCHYRTFPILAQDATELRSGLPPNVRVIEPEVLEPIEI